MYLGSDALALSPFTDRIAYLEEGDWVALTREGADIREASGKRTERRIQRSPAGSLLAEKGNYRHFMAKEIHEQPGVVGHPLARYIDMAALRLKPFAWPVEPKELKRVSIVGCGTAYMAGLVGKYWIERWARLPVEIDVASEYRYREAPVDDGGLTIVVSQSGETADTLASLRYVKERGAKTVGVVNVPGSSIARLTDAAAPTLATNIRWFENPIAVLDPRVLQHGEGLPAAAPVHATMAQQDECNKRAHTAADKWMADYLDSPERVWAFPNVESYHNARSLRSPPKMRTGLPMSL